MERIGSLLLLCLPFMLAIRTYTLQKTIRDHTNLTHFDFQSIKGHVVLHAAGGALHCLLTYFPEPEFAHFSIRDFNILELLKTNQTVPGFRPKILLYNIENQGKTYQAIYEIPRQLIALYNIPVLYHTSDEFLGGPKKWQYGEGTELYSLVPLVIREYGVYPYRNYKKPMMNVIQAPLCLPEGELNGTDVLSYARNSSFHLAKDRFYNWSFIGSTANGYRDRKAITEQYRQIWHPNLVTCEVPHERVLSYYRDSRFVLVAKGHINLECFRYVSAIIAGAIPIVYNSNLADIYREYEFEGDTPPMVYASSPDEMFQQAMQMSLDEIDRRRSELFDWFMRRVMTIRKKVEFAIRTF